MIKTTEKWFRGIIGLVLVTMICTSLEAQTRPKEGECRHDEIDLGDYCASLPPAVDEQEKKKRTVTRFRGKSMMPGLVSETSEKPPQTPVIAPEKAQEPVEQTPTTFIEGFMVQLGAFSTRERAEMVAASLVSTGAVVNVDPLQRGDKILWVCTIGPFPGRTTAEQARNQVRIDKRFSTAFLVAWKADPQ